MFAYLNKYKLLHEAQSGFWKHHSCQTALIKLINDWLSHIDRGKIVAAIFFDLKKAFDVVDHEILLQKLALYGVRGTSLHWFESYLSNRSQCVVDGWVESVKSPVSQKRCATGLRAVTGSVPYIYKRHATSVANGHRYIR